MVVASIASKQLTTTTGLWPIPSQHDTLDALNLINQNNNDAFLDEDAEKVDHPPHRNSPARPL
jgi:hypothetical protein